MSSLFSQSGCGWLRATLVCLAAAFAGGCGQTLDLESSKTFQAAEAAFTKATSAADYRQAAGLYQEILDRGVTSGAVLYNQGNAFMKAGERGRAIAAYRQALRYRPRDPFLDANLKYALGTDGPAQEHRSVMDYLLFWQKWVSYPEKFWLVTLAVALCSACGLLGRFARGRRVWNRLAIAGTVLTLIFGMSAAYDWYEIDRVSHGVTTAKETTARKGDAADYEPAFTAPLREGTEFTVVDRRGDWLLIHVAQTGDGWIEGKSAVTY